MVHILRQKQERRATTLVAESLSVLVRNQLILHAVEKESRALHLPNGFIVLEALLDQVLGEAAEDLVFYYASDGGVG